MTSLAPGAPGPLHVAAHARRESSKPAIVMAGSGETVTYDELDRRSKQLARVFADLGCRPGDHVAILLENHPRFAEVCWAAHRSGLYYTPINRQLTAGEAAGIVDDCGAGVLVTSAALRDTAAALVEGCAGLRSGLMLDGVAPHFERYEDAVEARSDAPLDEEVEGSAMIYSSGTTGRPKGIRRPASGRAPGTTLFGVDPSVADAYGLTRESRALVPVPLYHSSGLTRLMMCLCIGATVVLMERFDAEATLVAIERHGVTLGLFVPTMLVRMLRLDPAARGRYDVSTMTAATLGSGPCPPAVKAAVIEWWGPIVTETYGGTEGNGMTRITATEWLAHPGSVGRPVFGEVHVVGPDGRELGAGESGVVYFSGGRAFEYHNDPAKTAAAHDERGWSTLGDVGHVDADGYLYITDRVTDMIISGGVNIYPREVEDVLVAHPEVDDVAVIGVPNDDFGEEVKAIVKPRKGVTADDALRARLLEHARHSLARYKCPRTVDFVEEFPRQDTGKVYKRLLREPYWTHKESRVL